MSFEGVSSDLFIRDPLTKEAARVRDNSLQVIGAFFSIQEKYTGNNAVGQQFLLSHTPVLTNVVIEITADGINWTGFTSFTVSGQIIVTTAAIPASPANNVRVTYFIAKINTVATVTSPSLDQQVAQLSQIEINTSLLSPNVAFEVGQLSTIISELQGLSITIGDVDVNTDQLEDLTRQFQASNAEGLTNVILATVEGFTNVYLLLGQEVSQLSQIELNQVSNSALMSQEIAQLSQIITNTSASGIDTTQLLSHQVTQLSTLELYGSQQVDQLSNLNVSVSLEISQLTTIDLTTMNQITQLSTTLLYESQMVSQLSQVEINQIDSGALLAQEVAQLSDLQTSLATEVTQLSVLQSLSGLSINIGDIDLNTDDLENLTRLQTATIANGFTNVQNLVAQEVAQLSQIITNTGTVAVDTTPILSHQVEQLSTLELYGFQAVSQLSVVEINQTDGNVLLAQGVGQLSDLQIRVATEVTQLSVLQELKGLSINIGDIDVNTDELEGLARTQIATTAAGFTDTMIILAQEVGQLSQIITNTGVSDIDLRPLLSQEVTQLSDLNTAIVVEVTQLTTLQLYGSQEVAQLSQIIVNTAVSGIDTRAYLAHEITQLSTLQLYGSQEVGQLSTIITLTADASSAPLTTLLTQEVAQLSEIITNTSVSGIDIRPLLSQEVTQLSDLNAAVALEVTQLTTVNTTLVQEVAQLSTLNASNDSQVILLTQEVTQLTTLQLYGSQEVAQLSTLNLNVATAANQTAQITLLAQEVGQLSSIVTNTSVSGIDIRPLLSQEVTQLSDLNLAVALEITQLTTVNVTLAQEVGQLTTLNVSNDSQVTLLAQEVAQLSQIITNTATSGIDIRPLLSQEVTQLSNLNTAVVVEIQQLTTLQLYGSQEVEQLSQIITNTAVSGIDLRPLLSQEVAQLSIMIFDEVVGLTTSLNASTGKKTVVMKTGSLTTTATTADQIILTYTVTAGKTLYLEYVGVGASLTTASNSNDILGLASFENPSGTKVLGDYRQWPGHGPGVYPFSDPLPVAAGTVIRWVTTPAGASSRIWVGNFGGYEV